MAELPDRLKKMLEKMAEESIEISHAGREYDPEELATMLLVRYGTLLEENTFEPGQLVQFKENMRNTDIGEVFVVTEILETPLVDPCTTASNCDFGQKYDMRIGAMSLDGVRFLQFYVDSRRYEPYIEQKSKH